MYCGKTADGIWMPFVVVCRGMGVLDMGPHPQGEEKVGGSPHRFE